MSDIYSFSLQLVSVAKWIGDGTYGTPVQGESTKTLGVAEKMVSDKAEGNAVITATAAQVISYELSIDTAGFDAAFEPILYNVTPTSSGGITSSRKTNTTRMPYFGLIAQVFPDSGDVLHFFPKCKMMDGVKYSLDYGKIVIPKFTAMAIADPLLGDTAWARLDRTVSGSFVFPPVGF